MNSNNYEMATPINSLQNQNTNVNNLVRNVENNIETLNNSSNVPSSIPQNIANEPPKYNPNIPVQTQPPVQYTQVNPTSVYKEEPKKDISKNTVEKESLSRYIMKNVKEYLVITLLFSLLAHKKISKLFLNYIPFLAKYESPIPSLLLRGILFSVILIIIKKCI